MLSVSIGYNSAVSDLLLAARWLVAIVLLIAGIRKLLAPSREQTIKAVRSYGMLPDALVVPAACVLPWLEITLGALSCVGVAIVITAVCTALVFAAFAIAIGWHLLRGHRFACGCGGGGEISWQLVGRDFALCAIAIVIAIGPSAGLAIWPGWGAGAVARSAEALIPVPLITILLMIGARVVYQLGQARPQASRRPAF